MSSSTLEVLNKTWEYISSSADLSEWQKIQLYKINSVTGIQCLLRIWLNNSYEDVSEGSFCNATWDSVYCWPPLSSGIVVYKPCSEILREMHPKSSAYVKGIAKRTCIVEEGMEATNQIDYSECIQAYDVYLKRKNEDKYLAPMVQYMLFFGSILSLICLSASLAIFYHFRCLWCDRVTIHVHLMISLVFRFLLMFIISEPTVLDRVDNYRNVDILCKFILVLFLYTTVASVSWMLIQGLYLNITLLARVFTRSTRYHLWIYCIIGWVVPAGFVLVYVIAMTSKEQNKCWDGYGDMDEIWILLGPIMFAVVINGIFLLNVLRILLNKVRNSNQRNESSQIKAAAKATAVLFPVLGLNNLIFLYNPGGGFYKYFVALNTFFGATQGIFEAIVYCFIDKEVHAAFRRYWRRVNAMRNFDRGGSKARSNVQAHNQIPMQEVGSRQQNGVSVNTDSEHPM